MQLEEKITIFGREMTRCIANRRLRSGGGQCRQAVKPNSKHCVYHQVKPMRPFKPANFAGSAADIKRRQESWQKMLEYASTLGYNS